MGKTRIALTPNISEQESFLHPSKTTGRCVFGEKKTNTTKSKFLDLIEFICLGKVTAYFMKYIM